VVTGQHLNLASQELLQSLMLMHEILSLLTSSSGGTIRAEAEPDLASTDHQLFSPSRDAEVKPDLTVTVQHHSSQSCGVMRTEVEPDLPVSDQQLLSPPPSDSMRREAEPDLASTLQELSVAPGIAETIGELNPAFGSSERRVTTMEPTDNQPVLCSAEADNEVALLSVNRMRRKDSRDQCWQHAVISTNTTPCDCLSSQFTLSLRNVQEDSFECLNSSTTTEMARIRSGIHWEVGEEEELEDDRVSGDASTQLTELQNKQALPLESGEVTSKSDLEVSLTGEESVEGGCCGQVRSFLTSSNLPDLLQGLETLPDLLPTS
jgi:hypothetical protein